MREGHFVMFHKNIKTQFNSNNQFRAVSPVSRAKDENKQKKS